MEENKENKIVKKNRKVLRILGRLFLIFLIFLICSSISLYFLAQNKGFRSWTVAQILKYANGELIGKVELDDIKFTSFKGIELFNARLITAGDTVAFVPKITVKFEPEALLNSRINVYFLELENPIIKLLRSAKDSTWNISKIAKPSSDTSTTNSKLRIVVNNLVLKNATFIRYDSTLALAQLPLLDYDHLYAKNLNLTIGAVIDLQKNDFKASIKELNLVETRSGLKIKNFKTEVAINPGGISLSSTKLETDEIISEFDASMTNFNIFGTDDEQLIDKAIMNLDFRAESVNPRFVYYFAALDFDISCEHEIKIKASGTLNNLKVENLLDKFENTRIQFKGNLVNILEGDKFFYKVKFENTYFNRADAIKVLPTFKLESIPDYNYPVIDDMQVEGSSRDVKADFKFSLNEAKIDGKAFVNFENTDLIHRLDIVVQKLDLSKIFKDSELSTLINGSIIIDGKGDFSNTLADSVRLDLYTSSYKNIYLDKINLSGTTESMKKFKLDNIYLANKIDKEYDYKNLGYSSLTGNASFDFTNAANPLYKTDIKFEGFDIAGLLQDNEFPKYTSGKLMVDARSFDLDSITGKIDVHFEDFLLQDKAVFPFSLNVDILKLDVRNRVIDINSENFKAMITGDFTLSKLIQTLALQGVSFSKFINNKLSVLNPNNIELSDSLNTSKINSFPLINCDIWADVKDLTPVNLFLDSLQLNGNIRTSLHLENTLTTSIARIDTIALRSFSLQMPDLNVTVQSSDFVGVMKLNLIDSIPKFESFTLRTTQKTNLFVNSMKFFDSDFKIDYNSKQIEISTQTLMNKDFSIDMHCLVDVVKNNLNVKIDNLYIGFQNMYKWTNVGIIEGDFEPNGVNILACTIDRANAEKISISGAIRNKIAKDLTLIVNNYPLQEMFTLMPPEAITRYKTLKGNAKSVVVTANGDLSNPYVNFDFELDSMYFSNYKLGKLNGNLIHKDGIITGKAKILSPTDKLTVDIEVERIPLYLGTNEVESRYDHSIPSIVHAKSEAFPLQLAQPFIPNITNLQGNAKAELTINGELDDLRYYTGKVNVINSQFLLDPNNIVYNAKGDITFLNGYMRFSGFKLLNTDYDSRTDAGKAIIDGFIRMKKFDIDSLSLDISANRIKFLSDASAVTMPDLYGDFIVSSGPRKIQFYGTLQKPYLHGDAIINYADIKMPLEQSKQKFQTRLKYDYMDSKVKIRNVRTLDTGNAIRKDDDAEDKTSIADLINYKLDVFIMGQFSVLMDMGLLGNMYAVIGTPNKNEAFRYEKSRDNLQGNLFGELVLKKESTIKSFKILNTTGKLSFPTGSIENPYLDIVANYKGLLNDGNNSQNYTVIMYIVGPKQNPKITFSYSIDGVQATGDPERVSEDAIYLLITGKKKGSQGSQLNTANLAQESSLSMVSGFTSQVLTNLIGSSFIQNADINFKSNTFSEATYKISGQIAGGVSFTLGGSFDNIMNNEISIEIPMSTFLTNPFWNNFLIQVSRAMNVNATITNRESRLWEVKFKLWGSE